MLRWISEVPAQIGGHPGPEPLAAEVAPVLGLAQVELRRLLEAALHLEGRVVRGGQHLGLTAGVHEVDQYGGKYFGR